MTDTTTADLTVKILQEIRDESRETNQRLDETNQRLGRVETRLDETNQRLGRVETGLGETNQRLGRVETRLGETNRRLGVLETRFDNLLEFAGDRYRDHEERIKACERGIEELRGTG